MKTVKLVIINLLFITLIATLLSMTLFAATDKSELEAKNNEAIIAYYEEKDTYTSSSYNLFKTAVNDYGNYLYVNSVIADDNATQEDIDQLTQQIQSALDLLVLRADNTNLVALYNEISKTDLTGYTSDSKTAFQNELSRLYLIIVSDDLDQTKADQALIDLNKAQDLLVELPDVTQLQDLCDQAEVYREEDYSISSFGALQIAIDKSLDAINDDNASQAEIDQAYQDLSNAIDNLQDQSDTIYIKEGNKLDLDQFVTVGDSTIVSYISSNNEVLSIDGQGVALGKDYGLVNVTINLANGIQEKLQVKVEARVSTAILALSISIPFVGVAIGATMIFVNKESWLNLLRKTKNVFKRNRE